MLFGTVFHNDILIFVIILTVSLVKQHADVISYNFNIRTCESILSYFCLVVKPYGKHKRLSCGVVLKGRDIGVGRLHFDLVLA